MIFVDGVDIGDPADVALRDRRMLSADGIFIVVATVSEQTGESVVPPEVIFRGVPFIEQADEPGARTSATRSERSLGRRRAGGHPRDRPAPAGAARRPGRRSSTTGCGAGRWSCRSSSRSDADGVRRPARRRALGAAAPIGIADHEAGAGAVLGRLQLDRAAVRLGHRAHDRQPQPGAAAAVAAAAHEALEHPLLRARAGSRGRRPATISTASPSPARCWRAIVGAGRGVADRVLEQVEHQPVQLVADPVHDRRLGVDRQLVVGRPSARARPPPRSAPRPDRWAGGAGPARASARASSSRSPTSRRIRRVERSAASAVSACSPSSSSVEQLEVGEHAGQRRAQLVRGVGDELALAVEHRLRCRCAPSPAPPSIPSSVRASSAISSSASGWGICAAGSRVRSISRAASVSSTIGRIARCGRRTGRPAAPAPCRRARRAAGTPGPRRACGRHRTAAARRAASPSPAGLTLSWRTTTR